jgi:lipid-binding SYLF domain-containing protein
MLGAHQASAAASPADIDQSAARALEGLCAASDNACALAGRARAILVFGRVASRGFLLGGREGEGVMRIADAPAGYYRIVGAPAPVRAGADAFSLAFFFVTPAALAQLDRERRWEIGRGPSVAMADSRFARILDTTDLDEDVYATPFNQSGLLAGLGLGGSRIFRIHPPA